jgi:hypothetical protein
MTPRSRLARRIALALISIGAFSLVFSLLAENGLWPELPPGSLHNTDLAAGFLAAIGLLLLLALDKRAGSRRSAG